MPLEVKRGGEVIELSDDAKIVSRNRSFTLVMDGKPSRCFEILNEPAKRKRIIDAHLAKLPQQPEEVVIVKQPEESQQQAEDNAAESLQQIESLANDPSAPAPGSAVAVEDIEQAQQEEWHPREAEWYSATMRLHDRAKHYCILELSDGQTAFANVNSFSSSPGAHVCAVYVPKGSPAMVRLEETPTGLRCLEVIVEGLWQHDGAEDEAVVVHWDDRNVGNAERDCGCNILVLGNRDDLPFTPGDRIRGTFHWNSRRGNWSLQNPEKV